LRTRDQPPVAGAPARAPSSSASLARGGLGNPQRLRAEAMNSRSAPAYRVAADALLRPAARRSARPARSRSAPPCPTLLRPLHVDRRGPWKGPTTRVFHLPPTHPSSPNRGCPTMRLPIAPAGVSSEAPRQSRVPPEAPRLSAPATVPGAPRCTRLLSRARGDARLPNRARCDGAFGAEQPTPLLLRACPPSSC
jgi:hypothetical protein